MPKTSQSAAKALIFSLPCSDLRHPHWPHFVVTSDLLSVDMSLFMDSNGSEKLPLLSCTSGNCFTRRPLTR